MELLFLFVMFTIFGIGAGVYKFIKWILEGIFNFFSYKETHTRSQEYGEEIISETGAETGAEPEQTVIVKDPYFKPNQIQSYSNKNESAAGKKFIFRPKTLEEYIGQKKAKALVRLNLKKIKELKPVHFLISGHRGCGKTTLAHIIKNSLHAKLIERIAGEIQNPDQVVQLVNEINSSRELNVILFIDEIHALKPQLCENFYSIMEDYRIAGRDIKPFILIGATTEKNILMEKVAPMVDRFQVQIELEKYLKEDIVKIITQYKKQLFPNKPLPEGHFDIIAQNSKFTPRIAITLLEDSLVNDNIKHILECHRIIRQGLTDLDLRILKILQENKRPIGGKSLARMLGIPEKDYTTVYEPYLTEQEYIVPTNRGRVLGKKGEEFLEGEK